MRMGVSYEGEGGYEVSEGELVWASECDGAPAVDVAAGPAFPSAPGLSQSLSMSCW